MKKNSNRGFTIIELTITTVMIGVILIVAPVVILKRSTKTTKTNTPNNVAECKSGKCIYNARDSILKYKKDGKVIEEERYDYVRHTDKPYTIELRGGGGGGTSKSVGYPGGFVSIKLFSLSNNKAPTGESSNQKYEGILTGYYLMQVGKGGNTNKSGKDSVICIISESDAKKTLNDTTLKCGESNIIIARATGGITSNEKESDKSIRKSEEENGEGFGDGGDINKNGEDGIIVIK